jgi:hypothetical protein
MPIKNKTAKTAKTTKTAKAAKSEMPASPELNGTARQWLRENGHEDICALIDRAMAHWAKQGITTRRNWWDILSGDKNGQSRIVAGREFPVLAAAQQRQGKAVTSNAIPAKRGEVAPGQRESSRWT